METFRKAGQKVDRRRAAYSAPRAARYYGGLGGMLGRAHPKEVLAVSAGADQPCALSSIKLTKNVSAIPCAAGISKQDRIGPVCQLRAGTELIFCGPGYCKATIKVRDENGQCFFVFAQDVLESDHLSGL